MIHRIFGQFSCSRSTQYVCLPAIAVVLLSATVMAAPEIAPQGAVSRPDGDGSDGAKAVKAFLTKTYPKQGWAKGPTPVDSDAIRKAYSTRKFYYVFSSSYPVARSGRISAMVGIGKDAKPVLVRTPADFSAGLAAIKTADDARTAAAAVLSLVMTWRGPISVTAKEITAKKTADGGWKCAAKRGVPKPGPGGIGVAPRGGLYFYADFGADGKCTRVQIDDRSPRPICIGGLFWRVNSPQDMSVELGQAQRAGLLTASVKPDSIAAKAGLQSGDMIVSFGDKPLPSDDTIGQLRQVVYALKQQGGIQRPIAVRRDGRFVTLTLRW